MRIVNVGQRLVLLDASGAGLDVEKASDGRFPVARRRSSAGGMRSGSGPRPTIGVPNVEETAG